MISLWFQKLQKFQAVLTKLIYFSHGNRVGMVEGASGKEGSPLGDSQATVLTYFRHREVLDFPTTLSGVQWRNWGSDKTMELWVVRVKSTPLPAVLPCQVLGGGRGAGQEEALLGTSPTQEPCGQEIMWNPDGRPKAVKASSDSRPKAVKAPF